MPGSSGCILTFKPCFASSLAGIHLCVAFIMSAPALSPEEQAAQAAMAAAAEQFNIEAFTLLGVGLFITILRTYTRISTVGWRRLEVDDYLIWFAAVWLCLLSMKRRLCLTNFVALLLC